ncbi:hypothetical protein [Nonomuraea wenchangensis]
MGGTTAEHITPEPEQEQAYPDEARAEALAIMCDIIGEEEFAAYRAQTA